MKETPPLEDPLAAVAEIRKAYKNGEVLTGIFYTNRESKTLLERLPAASIALASYNADELRPSAESFERMMAQYM